MPATAGNPNPLVPTLASQRSNNKPTTDLSAIDFKLPSMSAEFGASHLDSTGVTVTDYTGVNAWAYLPVPTSVLKKVFQFAVPEEALDDPATVDKKLDEAFLMYDGTKWSNINAELLYETTPGNVNISHSSLNVKGPLNQGAESSKEGSNTVGIDFVRHVVKTLGFDLGEIKFFNNVHAVEGGLNSDIDTYYAGFFSNVQDACTSQSNITVNDLVAGNPLTGTLVADKFENGTPYVHATSSLYSGDASIMDSQYNLPRLIQSQMLTQIDRFEKENLTSTGSTKHKGADMNTYSLPFRDGDTISFLVTVLPEATQSNGYTKTATQKVYKVSILAVPDVLVVDVSNLTADSVQVSSTLKIMEGAARIMLPSGEYAMTSMDVSYEIDGVVNTTGIFTGLARGAHTATVTAIPSDADIRIKSGADVASNPKFSAIKATSTFSL